MAGKARKSPARISADPTDCVCLGLRKATRAITKVYDDALKPCDLKATQFSLLGHLAYHDAVGFSELTEQLTMDQTTLTRNLRPLERRGLIVVRPGEDRRTRLISLTDEGRALVGKALPLWQRTQQRVMQRLGKGRWLEMRGELTRLTREFAD